MAVKIFDKSAEVSYKVKDAIEKTGIDPQIAGLALSLAFGGPIGLAKEIIVDAVARDEIVLAAETLKNQVTAVVRQSDRETVSELTSDELKKQGDTRTLEISEQVQRTKDGVGFLAGVVGIGSIGGTAKTVKIDGNDVEVSAARSILKKDPVRELEVGSYKELKSRAQVGDDLEHDHIPHSRR